MTKGLTCKVVNKRDSSGKGKSKWRRVTGMVESELESM